MSTISEDLRAFADWLEEHPIARVTGKSFFFCVADGKEDFAAIAREIGSFRKDPDDTWISIEKRFGSIHYRVIIAREEICEKVVIGKKTVPATEAITIPAKPEREEEIVEWRCHSIFAEEKV